MKKYLLFDFGFDTFKEMISEGDDTRYVQIRVDENGYIFLSQEFVGNQNLDDIKFRLPTMGGDYTGSIECATSIYEGHI